MEDVIILLAYIVVKIGVGCVMNYFKQQKNIMEIGKVNALIK
jgi:hypothetical protein